MPYPSDLTDQDWEEIKEFFPEQGKRGRPRKHSHRHVLNAIFYIDRTGCQWRYLPSEFPPWQTVYTLFLAWQKDGRLERLHDALRRRVRVRMGREPEPSAAIIDSQSVRTTETATKNTGYDGNKKVKGRKRHILTDSLGLLLAVWVHSAQIQDRTAARQFVEQTPAPSERLAVVWADMGYISDALTKDIREKWHARLEIKKHPWQGSQARWVKKDAPEPEFIEKPKHFVVLPKRWVVERTFAWIGKHRRHSKDYERLPHHSEAWLRWSMTRNMLSRLATLPHPEPHQDGMDHA